MLFQPDRQPFCSGLDGARIRYRKKKVMAILVNRKCINSWLRAPALRDGQPLIAISTKPHMQNDTCHNSLTGQQYDRSVRAVFESSPDSVFLIESSGTILDANRAFAIWTGTTLQECAGRNINLFLPPELAVLLKKNATVALQSGKHLSFEDAGNIHPLLYSLYPSRSRSGELNQLLIIARQGDLHIGKEITGRKPAKESDQESKTQFKKLFNNMTNGSAYCRMVFEEGKPVDFIHEEVNPDFEKLTGLSNLEGRSASEAIPGIRHSHPELFEKLGRVVQQGVVERFELHMHELHKWVDISAYSPKQGDFIAIVNDISDRKQAEEALRQSEKRFRNLFENNALVKILLDPETGRIIDANQAAAAFYGWTQEVLSEMHIWQINILPPEEVKRTLELCRTSKQNRFILHHRRADHSVRDVEVFTSLITIEGKELIYAIIHDVTERTRFEALTAVRLRLHDIAESNPRRSPAHHRKHTGLLPLSQ